MKLSTGFTNRQRGAVLVVSLIMLAVMTLLVITMIKTAVLDLKIGGANQQSALNLANAEVALNRYLAANPTAFLFGCLLAPAPNNCRAGLGTLDLAGSRVVITATQVGCIPAGSPGSGTDINGLPIVTFDARAGASGLFGGVAAFGATAVHQGFATWAPRGTCL